MCVCVWVCGCVGVWVCGCGCGCVGGWCGPVAHPPRRQRRGGTLLQQEGSGSVAALPAVAYNIATNTNTYKNTSSSNYSTNPLNCSKLLGLSTTTDIALSGITSSYVNLVNYQQVILKCPTLVFENASTDNMQGKDNLYL